MTISSGNSWGSTGATARPTPFSTANMPHDQRSPLLAAGKTLQGSHGGCHGLRVPGRRHEARRCDGQEPLDRHGLGVGVFEDSMFAVPAADARVLPATHRGIHGSPRGRIGLVDIDGSGLQPACDLAALVSIAGPDREVQAVAADVGQLDGRSYTRL